MSSPHDLQSARHSNRGKTLRITLFIGLVIILGDRAWSQETVYSADEVVRSFEKGSTDLKGHRVAVRGTVSEIKTKEVVFKSSGNDKVTCQFTAPIPSAFRASVMTVSGTVKGRSIKGNVTLADCAIPAGGGAPSRLSLDLKPDPPAYSADALMSTFEKQSTVSLKGQPVVVRDAVVEVTRDEIVFKSTGDDKVVCELTGGAKPVTQGAIASVAGIVKGRGIRGNVTLTDCSISPEVVAALPPNPGNSADAAQAVSESQEASDAGVAGTTSDDNSQQAQMPTENAVGSPSSPAMPVGREASDEGLTPFGRFAVAGFIAICLLAGYFSIVRCPRCRARKFTESQAVVDRWVGHTKVADQHYRWNKNQKGVFPQTFGVTVRAMAVTKEIVQTNYKCSLCKHEWHTQKTRERR